MLLRHLGNAAPEEGRKRHLIRLWLRDRGRRFYNG
jgi:hypothetical protein